MEIHRPEGTRLQKVLAAAGLGSRRACEDMIAAARVTVDGEVVDAQGTRVDPETVVIEVDGKRVHVAEGHLTVVLNKPAGVVSTMDDPEGRPDLTTYTREFDARLFHVGRLDAETTGVLLLTNHGEMAHRLAHPSHGVDKVYLAKVAGRVTPSVITALKSGVDLEDGSIRITEGHVVDTHDDSSLVEVTLHEGRNRIVRRMFNAVGFPVTELVRTSFGPVTLGTLAPGQTRELGRDEVGALMKAAGL